MPVIKVTQKDLARMNPPDAGTYLAILREVNENISKDKGSVNWTFDFEIQSPGVNNGRYVTGMANSKAPMMFLGDLISAMMDIPKDQIPLADIDTDKLIGKPVGVEVFDDIWEGKIVKKIKQFISPQRMNAPF